MRKTITKLESNPTKEAEIQYLREVQDGIPPNSYLASLFTDQFIGWVKANINADFPSDILEVVGLYAGNLQNASQDLSDLRKQVEKLERENRDLRVKCSASADREVKLRGTVEGLIYGVQVDVQTRLDEARGVLRKI